MIKECSSRGALYTTDYCCSNGSLVDKIICDLNEAPDSPHLHTFSSNQRHCFQCKDVLGDGEFCQQCTSMRYGSGLSKGLCLICGNNQNSLNDSPSISDNSSQSPPHINHHCCYECGDPLEDIFCQQCTCKSCGKGTHYGYNCPSKVSIRNLATTKPLMSSHRLCQVLIQHAILEMKVHSLVTQLLIMLMILLTSSTHLCNPQKPCYNQDFNFPQNSQNFQQQYLCCTCCGGPHETFQCQQVIFYEPCCENYGGPHETYQCQPMNEDCYHEQNSFYNSNSFGFDQFLPQQLPVIDQTPLEESMKNLQIAFQAWSENIQQKKEEEEKQIVEEQVAKAQYRTKPICYDDDEDYTISITPKETDNSLCTGNEHLDTIPATESDKFIKSSVGNLVPNPSESEGEHEYDVPACDDFTTFSNILFDADDDFSSKSLFNQDSSIISSPSKIDSLLDVFAGELTLLKSIPPGINETDYNPEEEIRLIKKLLYDNSSPQINLSFTPDDPMPPGIEEDDYDSKRDILILEEFLSNDSLSLSENESFYFDIPSSSRPPAKPPDGNSGILNVKVMGDISEHNVPMPRLMLTQNSLVLNQEKSPNLLSHRGHKASQPSTECLMMIYGRNTPILDVSFLHFYPL
nr:hypothetical protein [Tanacetum cinerariifolium]